MDVSKRDLQHCDSKSASQTSPPHQTQYQTPRVDSLHNKCLANHSYHYRLEECSPMVLQNIVKCSLNVLQNISVPFSVLKQPWLFIAENLRPGLKMLSQLGSCCVLWQAADEEFVRSRPGEVTVVPPWGPWCHRGDPR